MLNKEEGTMSEFGRIRWCQEWIALSRITLLYFMPRVNCVCLYNSLMSKSGWFLKKIKITIRQIKI